jgi:hypothetical protein
MRANRVGTALAFIEILALWPMVTLAAGEGGVSQQTINAALVLSGVAFLIPTINGIVQIWNATRRKPPIDQELQFYAKKSDLAAVEERLRDQMVACCVRHEKAMEKHSEEQTNVIRDIFSRVNSAQKAVEETFKDIMHELGVLTGRIQK